MADQPLATFQLKEELPGPKDVENRYSLLWILPIQTLHTARNEWGGTIFQ